MVVVEYRFGDVISTRFWEIGWGLALSIMRKEYLYVIICLAHELYVVTKACVERYWQFCTVHQGIKPLEGCEELVLADGLAMKASNRARSQLCITKPALGSYSGLCDGP